MKFLSAGMELPWQYLEAPPGVRWPTELVDRLYSNRRTGRLAFGLLYAAHSRLSAYVRDTTPISQGVGQYEVTADTAEELLGHYWRIRRDLRSRRVSRSRPEGKNGRNP